MNRRWHAYVITLILLVLATPLWGAETKPSSEPVEITSHKMVSEKGGEKIIFLGEVVAKQGDTTLYCEEMHVFQEQGGSQIQRIEAYRQVRIVQEGRVATGDRGTFFQLERKVVLQGNARAVSGQDEVEGETITYFLDQENIQVDAPEGGRVKATFSPKGESQ